MNSGMIQFNEEGIEKLVSVFDGDIDALLDKANELLDASKEYKNFSGIADGMDGSVKFIIETAAIEADLLLNFAILNQVFELAILICF